MINTVLKQILNKRRITQRELAKKLGVTGAAVFNWCNGISTPSRDKLPRLARTLGVSIDDLFNENYKDTQAISPWTCTSFDRERRLLRSLISLNNDLIELYKVKYEKDDTRLR